MIQTNKWLCNLTFVALTIRSSYEWNYITLCKVKLKTKYKMLIHNCDVNII